MDFRTQYPGANTEIRELRSERKKPVVPKDATGNGSEARLGDYGDLEIASPQGKRISEIDGRIRAGPTTVADICAQVEQGLFMQDRTSEGKTTSP